MKSTFGEHIQISLFGESHGAAIGVKYQRFGTGHQAGFGFYTSTTE